MYAYERLINDEKSGMLINLDGLIATTLIPDKVITVGKSVLKSFFEIKRSNITIDGSSAKIYVTVKGTVTSDYAIMQINPAAENVCLRNLDITVCVEDADNTGKILAAIYNMAQGTRIENCRITMTSKTQVQLCGIYNKGDKDYLQSYKGRNLLVRDCDINVQCLPESITTKCCVYGIYNNEGNGISVSNSIVLVMNDGYGSLQRSIGVFTNGRFGRFIANNIKAQTPHIQGLLLEKAHAIGFINEGAHSVLSANNIVAECAGACIGVENKGFYARIADNKILATHTVWGRSVVNTAPNVVINANVITSTAKNARLVEQYSYNTIITNNFMRVLLRPPQPVRTGCGIYAIGSEVYGNVITNNIIKDVYNCGILASETCGIVENNIVTGYNKPLQHTTDKNKAMTDIFRAGNIRSIE